MKNQLRWVGIVLLLMTCAPAAGMPDDPPAGQQQRVRRPHATLEEANSDLMVMPDTVVAGKEFQISFRTKGYMIVYKVLDRRGKVLATKRLAAPLPATFVLDKPGKYSVTAYIDTDMPVTREMFIENPGKRSLIVIPAKEQSKQDEIAR